MTSPTSTVSKAKAHRPVFHRVVLMVDVVATVAETAVDDDVLAAVVIAEDAAQAAAAADITAEAADGDDDKSSSVDSRWSLVVDKIKGPQKCGPFCIGAVR
jgi:hypothetical protein